MKPALDWQKQVGFIKATQVRLEFPNIIRSGLSANPFRISTSTQRRTPLLEPSPTAITPEVYEEMPPDTVPTPWPEPVLPKTNGKAADKRFWLM